MPISPIVALMLAALPPDGASGPPRFVEVPGVMEFSGRIIARPHVGELRAFDERWKDAIIQRVDATRERILRVPGTTTDDAFAGELARTGTVEYAEPDWICYPIGTTPSDTDYPVQWQHPVIESPAAWDLWRGSASITLAFVDTGIDLTHPDLAALRLPGFNSVTDLPETAGGDISAINPHGTAVAGTACAIGNNALGVCGTVWNVPFMMVRTSDDPGGGAYISDLTQGARWAIENGARSASVSYSGITNSSIQTSGTYIKSIGGLLVWAAGNNGALFDPFDWTDVIIVGATNSGDGRAGFSNYGQCIDVVAPGEGVYTTTVGGGTGPASGTSFAAPMANGIIGLIWSANPALTPAQVETILFSSCTDLGTPGEDDTFGHGRINARRAAELALASSTTPLAPMAADDDYPVVFKDQARVLPVLANDRDPRGTGLTLSAPGVSTAGATLTTIPAEGATPERILYTPLPGFAGSDSFVYTVTNGAGLSASATVEVNVLDPATFRTPDAPSATRPGVDVAYYAGAFSLLPDFSLLTPYATDSSASINFPSTGGVFATSGRADDVAARFTGYLIAPTADRYTLSIESDDGSKLYVGGQLLVGNDGLHGMQDKSETIDLQPGTHAITVEFFERGGGAGVILRWASSTIGRQPVPPASLVRDRCLADTDGDGDVDSDDITLYFASWDAGEGDLDGDDDSDSDDLVAFFSRWDAGC